MKNKIEKITHKLIELLKVIYLQREREREQQLYYHFLLVWCFFTAFKLFI